MESVLIVSMVILGGLGSIPGVIFGLAPIIVSKIFKTINGINREGVTVLLVEQNARAALKLSHRGYVLENGRIALEGKGEELLNNEQVRGAYQIRPLVS
jgi:ABC-type branched-subunit amino acid transport system ATPase component